MAVPDPTSLGIHLPARGYHRPRHNQELVKTKVLGIDPGGTTGWATFVLDQFWSISLSAHFPNCGQIGPEQHHDKLWDLMDAERRANEFVIVCESFEHSDNRAAQLEALEYIGVAKCFAQKYGMRIVMQQRTAKRWADDVKLGKFGLGYDCPYELRHQRDARRHLVYYIGTNTYVPKAVQSRFLNALKPREFREGPTAAS